MSSGTEQFTIGSLVRCSDGDCGTLRRVVVEPIDRVLTHLVVEPEERERAGRLVPVDLVDWDAKALAASEIVLRCSLADFEAAAEAQETHFLSGSSGQWGYEQDQLLSWPNYPLGAGGREQAVAVDESGIAADESGIAAVDTFDTAESPFGTADGGFAAPVEPVEPVAPVAPAETAGGTLVAGDEMFAAADGPLEAGDEGVSTGMEGFSADAVPHVVVRERIPVGEVQIRRGEHVHAVDGSIGRVQGLVVDPADRRVTHVLLDQGHLWGQKRVAIPIGAVTDILDGVQIDLTKDQVRDLPEVDVDLTD